MQWIHSHFAKPTSYKGQSEIIMQFSIGKASAHQILHEIQSNLVISNSLISNYRLSRSENLVPVLI